MNLLADESIEQKVVNHLRLLTAITQPTGDIGVTTIIEREDDLYVALNPILDIASQGKSVVEAKHNLAEAITLFYEVASPTEIETRLRRAVSVYKDNKSCSHLQD